MQADSRSFTERQDDEVQRRVLRFVLAEYPAVLSAADLAMEFGADGAPFEAVDALERAIRDLAAVGLLRRESDSLFATRAALRFERLESL